MDDVLIASRSVRENLEILEEVLIILRKYGFELNYAKCKFLRVKIEFLGYAISEQGVTLCPRHTEAIRCFRQPNNVHEVQRFLGLTGYFRKFIEKYAVKTKPLYNLLKKEVKFEFDAECQQSFENLKKELTLPPTLQLYNPQADTELHTDACSQGLGAILLQKQRSGTWAPVAYYSQATNNAEKKYHGYELEMLAVVRAIERFHIYLYGLKFTVITDCHALVYAMNKASLNPRIARWTLTLQSYDFKVAHRPGRRMAHVDALSRGVGYVNQLPLERELEYRQLTDPRILQISRELELANSDSDKYALVDGLVYKKSDDKLQFIVPDTMISNIIRAHHDDMAHCGLQKTVEGIQKNFWFPSMRKKIVDHIENCLTCLMSDKRGHAKEGETCLYPLSKNPVEILHIDHFGPLQETSDNFKHILVVIDSFTRFTWLEPTKSTGSKEVVKALSKIFDTFGRPIQLVTDRGTAFTSAEFKAFIDANKIEHRQVAVASPWANGLAERVNRFLKSSLTKMLKSAPEWKSKLGSMQYVINNTHHSGIKATPAKLMLGYEQRNHEDFPLAQFTQAFLDIDTNLEAERDRVRDNAVEATDLIRHYNKQYRDNKHEKPTKYKEGTFVMIRNTRIKPGENAKLKPNYKGPYLVAKSLGNNRYVIKDIPGYNLTSKPLNTILSSDKLKPWIKMPEIPETT